jgi:hypothetical protein
MKINRMIKWFFLMLAIMACSHFSNCQNDVQLFQGGICASLNSIIATLPKTLPNSYIISSIGCADKDDNLHFSADGHRILGKRSPIKCSHCFKTMQLITKESV